MTAYNMVRFKVKPGREKEFLDAHRNLKRDFPGLRRGGLIKTGERTYGFVGEWDDMASIAAARPAMITTLDSFRDTLEDLGGGLGVTDPVSGELVVDIEA
jgi:antibiotic biosynthesis monooxygenase (ABM) superfamily enzyme